MIVLGIDTSGYSNTIGVTDGGRVLADFTREARADSLEKIVADIDGALRSAGLGLEDVQGIGVGLGPGSWTGIRVGVTVGKMLAFAGGKPVAGVPTLAAMAYAAGAPGPVCAVIYAGTGETVYAACYDSSLVQSGEYYVGDVGGLAPLMKEPAVLVGEKAADYVAALQPLLPPGIALKAVAAAPSGVAVARLAARRLERGDGDDALALAPLYLKESTARALVNKYAARGS